MKYLIIADIKVLFRIPIALFFNIFFPLFISTLMIAMVGNVDIGNGMNFADKYYLIGLAFGVAPLTLISLPISISDMFNSGILERYHLFNVNIKKVIFSQIIVYFFLSIFEYLLITIYLYVFFSLSYNCQQILFIFSIYILVCFSMILLGICLGLLLKNKETAQSIGLVLMFLFLMLIGGFGDLSNLPNIFTDIAKVIPLNILTQNTLNVLINGEQLPSSSYTILIVYILLFSAIDIFLINKRFKKI